jgi:1-acyl-sn-glycerol-3-phosphate acyltransferase
MHAEAVPATPDGARAIPPTAERKRDVLSEALHWVERGQHLVPRRDRRILLSPPRLVARFLRFAWLRHAGHLSAVPADDIDARDPELVELAFDLLRSVFGRYFRLRVEGVDHVPAAGAVLLVGNHNGGLVPMDSFFTAMAIHDRQGPYRAVYGLTHDFLFEDPMLRSYAKRLGMLRAGHGSAGCALAAGHCVLVYPGSDVETFRTFGERHRIVLGGRTGFLELALRERVPIVPVVSVGTHEQFIVLARGDRLARALHTHAWARTEVLPLVLALPWGATLGFVPYLPLPAQTTIAFGEPIRWPELDSGDADNPQVLRRCYLQVEARMQQMLDRLALGRRFLLGTPRADARGVPRNRGTNQWHASRPPRTVP